MRGFTFSLAEKTHLVEGPDGYFFILEIPLKILRINETLFWTLRHLREGGELAELRLQNPSIKEDLLLLKLLSLTSGGYLNLENIAAPEEYPQVSVIIPVRDQPGDLSECLRSLAELDYPPDKYEVIVVDDGSEKAISVTPDTNIRLIRLEESQGASACRNIGAESAGGDILAFLDADCIAGKGWLREIAPFFGIEGIGAVGGFVDSYYRKRCLDRYEEVASSLNTGKRIIFQGNTGTTFYVPTCNMLVSQEVFKATSGFRNGMHVGEDVDFCWRMRKLGYYLLYAPLGGIAHKHRNILWKMLRRRNDYGTSEAELYRSHRDKKKNFPLPFLATLSLAAFIVAIALRNPYPACLIPLCFGIDLYRKASNLKKFKISSPFRRIVSSTLGSYLSFSYAVSFHLVRYYLILTLGLGFLAPVLWLFSGLALLLASVIDYHVKKPKLLYPVFLFHYTLEHLAYQTGVFRGCLKHRYFGCYIPVLRPVW